MRYTIMLERDDEAGMYVVSVPALPGCFTQAATLQQALERVREAIAGHSAALTATGQGQPVPVEQTPPLVTAVDVVPAA